MDSSVHKKPSTQSQRTIQMLFIIEHYNYMTITIIYCNHPELSLILTADLGG